MQPGRPKLHKPEVILMALSLSEEKVPPKDIRTRIKDTYGVELHRNVLLYWRKNFERQSTLQRWNG